ncbi:MAG: DUF4270 domain-containing protein [Alistipes sp.]|nr:DUF4270 domain-containing protein [Alistipes sp.]
MKIFNRFRPAGFVRALAFLLAAAAAPACTTVDDSVGSNLVPDNQQMVAGYTTLPRKGGPAKRYIETRLFRSDSIVSSNIGYGYMGSECNDTLGVRTAGFLTQFLDDMSDFRPGFFGYKPFVDSAQLRLSISQYGADTLTPQNYCIYEIISNDYLAAADADTTFYLSFDPLQPIDDKPVVSDEPLFRFTFPDGRHSGPSSAGVRLTITDRGERFIRRLMLQEGTYKDDYSIYTSADSLVQWLDEFKGLCILPESDQTEKGRGSIYATDLASTALTIYGRNRVEADPSLIQDTLQMRYVFYHTGSDVYGNVSVNTLRHDYAKGSLIDPACIAETDSEQVTENKIDGRVIVEGMGGVVTGITFAQPFFDELEALIAEANTGGQNYSTLAFSQVRMSIYFTDSNYDPLKIDPAAPGRLICEMDAAPSRIGLYTDYKRLIPITDYSYAKEKNNSLTLAYDGKINRSHGCYRMDITGYVQTLWNSYLAERTAAEAEGRETNLANVENRTVYAAPEAYGLYTSDFCVLQGMAPDDGAQDTAPIRFEIAYNLIK